MTRDEMYATYEAMEDATVLAIVDALIAQMDEDITTDEIAETFGVSIEMVNFIFDLQLADD